MIDIRKLSYAVALAEELNYVRAARRLSITQSALSRSISSLEEEWGVSLFDRDQTGVRLTAFGANFILSAKQLLRETEAFSTEMLQLKGGMTGRLSIGVAPALTHTLIPQVLIDLIARNPGLHIDIDTKGWQTLTDDLLKGHIELLIMTDFSVSRSLPRIEMRPLIQIKVRAFVRPGHPVLRATSSTKMQEMLAYPVLVQRLNDLNMQIFREVFLGLEAGQEFRSVISCDDMSLMKEVLANTDSVLFTANDTVAQEVREGTLAEVPMDEVASLTGQVVIATLKGKSLSPLAKLVMDKLLSQSALISKNLLTAA